MALFFPKLDNFNTKIVYEKNDIPGFEDGNIYICAARTDMLVEALRTAVSNFKKSVPGDRLIYPYGIRVIENAGTMPASGNLFDAIQNGVNLVLPICTPSETEKLYIVAKAGPALLDMFIPSMAMQAENLTKKSIEEALINLAVQESESCNKFLGDVFLNNLLPDADNNPAGVYYSYSMPPTSDLYELVPSNTSYKKSREIMSRFVKNCKLVNKSNNNDKLSAAQERQLKKAQGEIIYVFNLFTPNVYSRFTLQMMKMKSISMAFDNCINRDKIAANSKIKVSVELAKPEIDAELDPKKAKKLKTNGRYRVYLSVGGKIEQVKFRRTVSCVVYIMYLLDRKLRGEEIDTLKIADNEDLFCKLYTQVYNATKEQTKEKFNSLVKRYNGNVKRSRLADYYSDIREALDESVSKFGESPLPFYIPNEYSHITVLSSNIFITEAFENMVFVY